MLKIHTEANNEKTFNLFIALISILISLVACNNSVDDIFDNKPENNPLTLEFIDSGNVTLTKEGNPGDVYYSLDLGITTTIAPFDTPITVPAGGKISFYRNLDHDLDEDYFTINCDKDCYAYGNVMSLISKEGFGKANKLFEYALYNLFKDNTHIKNHNSIDLVLPATELSYWCYGSMFEGCKGLKKTPKLPATKMAKYCYYKMFSECTGLEVISSISATELADSCCQEMFAGCTGLKTVPKDLLPATKMNEGHCYRKMFAGCTSLINAPNLPATELAELCYAFMFQNCTSLETAPVLPAESLKNACYYDMFAGCSSLQSITCLAITYESTLFGCLHYWLDGVAGSGTFYRSPNVPDSFWTSDIPYSGWTIQVAQ